MIRLAAGKYFQVRCKSLELIKVSNFLDFNILLYFFTIFVLNFLFNYLSVFINFINFNKPSNFVPEIIASHAHQRGFFRLFFKISNIILSDNVSLFCNSYGSIYLITSAHTGIDTSFAQLFNTFLDTLTERILQEENTRNSHIFYNFLIDIVTSFIINAFWEVWINLRHQSIEVNFLVVSVSA